MIFPLNLNKRIESKIKPEVWRGIKCFRISIRELKEYMGGGLQVRRGSCSGNLNKRIESLSSFQVEPASMAFRISIRELKEIPFSQLLSLPHVLRISIRELKVTIISPIHAWAFRFRNLNKRIERLE